MALLSSLDRELVARAYLTANRIRWFPPIHVIVIAVPKKA
jgi:hypothetical protein